MERQLPKNVRQIGNVNDGLKIYVEDYVDIYLNQLQQQATEAPVGAMLIGEILKLDGQDVVCISGAMRIREVRLEGAEVIIAKELFQDMEEARKKYFLSSEAVGWCLIESGRPAGQDKEITKLHGKAFPREHTVFIWKDALENEETLYSFKKGELREAEGYYIYYEKNPSMQNYMIMMRKRSGESLCEMVEDRAAKDFRSAVRIRAEEKERQSARLIYATSVLLVIVVLVIGISTFNNFDKMEAVQESLESLSRSVNQKSRAETVSEDNPVAEAGQMTENAKVGAGSGNLGGEGAEGTEGIEGTEGREGTVPEKSTIQEQLGNESYYTVQKGDTLDSISMKLYGDISYAKAICKMNGLSDGNLIYIGQKLLLP